MGPMPPGFAPHCSEGEPQSAPAYVATKLPKPGFGFAYTLTVMSVITIALPAGGVATVWHDPDTGKAVWKKSFGTALRAVTEPSTVMPPLPSPTRSRPLASTWAI